MKLVLLAAALATTVPDGPEPVGPPGTEAEAVALVRRLGGKVEFAAGDQGQFVARVDLSKTKVTNEQLDVLRSLPGLQALDLRLTGITDSGVARLASLRHLRSLNLFRTPLTDAGLTALAGMTSLETLLLGGTKVTDRGMPTLLALTSLVVASGRAAPEAPLGGLRHVRRPPTSLRRS